MNFYDVTFFLGEKDSLRAHATEIPDQFWPITLRINSSRENFDHPSVCFHCSKDQLFSFLSSLTSACEKLNDADFLRETEPNE